MLNLELGGIGNEQSLLSVGSTFTYAMRGYSKNFEFASIGVSALAKYLSYSDDFRSNEGVEVGVGLELSLGALFYDQPYLFGAFSNSVFLTYNSVNGSISLLGRVGFRFDWAFPDRSTKEEIWE